jgi:hypothetical protein
VYYATVGFRTAAAANPRSAMTLPVSIAYGIAAMYLH